MCDVHAIQLFQRCPTNNKTASADSGCLLCIAHDAFSHPVSATRLVALQELELGISNVNLNICNGNQREPFREEECEFLCALASPLTALLAQDLPDSFGQVCFRVARLTIHLLHLATERALLPSAQQGLLAWSHCCCVSLNQDTSNKALLLTLIADSLLDLASTFEVHGSVLLPGMFRVLDASQDLAATKAAWGLALDILSREDNATRILKGPLQIMFSKFPETLLAGMLRGNLQAMTCFQFMIESMQAKAEPEFWTYFQLQSELLLQALEQQAATVELVRLIAGLSNAVPASQPLLNRLCGHLFVALLHSERIPRSDMFQALTVLLTVISPVAVTSIPSRKATQIVLAAIQILKAPSASLSMILDDIRVLLKLLALFAKTDKLSAGVQNVILNALANLSTADVLEVLSMIAVGANLQIAQECLQLLRVVVTNTTPAIRNRSIWFISHASKIIRDAILPETITLCSETIMLLFDQTDVNGQEECSIELVCDNGFHQCVHELLSAARLHAPAHGRRVAEALQSAGYFRFALDSFDGKPEVLREVFTLVLQSCGFLLPPSSAPLEGINIALRANWQQHLDRIGSSSSLLLVWGMWYGRCSKLSGVELNWMVSGLQRWLPQKTVVDHAGRTTCKVSPTTDDLDLDVFSESQRDLDDEELIDFPTSSRTVSMTASDWTAWMLLYSQLPDKGNLKGQKRLRRSLATCWFTLIAKLTRREVVQGMVRITGGRTLSDRLHVVQMLLDIETPWKEMQLFQTDDELGDLIDDGPCDINDMQGGTYAFAFWSVKDLVDMCLKPQLEDEAIANRVVQNLLNAESICNGLSIDQMFEFKRALLQGLESGHIEGPSVKTISRWMAILSWLVCLADEAAAEEPRQQLIGKLAAQCIRITDGETVNTACYLTPFATKAVLVGLAIATDMTSSSLMTRASLLRLVPPRDIQHHVEPVRLMTCVVRRLSTARAAQVEPGDLTWLQTSLDLGVLNIADCGDVLRRLLIPLLAQHRLPRTETLNCIRALLVLTQDRPLPIDCLAQRGFTAGLHLFSLESDPELRSAGLELLQTISLGTINSESGEGYLSIWFEDEIASKLKVCFAERRRTSTELFQGLVFIVLMRGGQRPMEDDDLIWTSCVRPILLDMDWMDEDQVAPVLLLLMLIWKRLSDGHDENLVDRVRARLLELRRNILSMLPPSLPIGDVADGIEPGLVASLSRAMRDGWTLEAPFAKQVLKLMTSKDPTRVSSAASVGRTRVIASQLVDMLLKSSHSCNVL